MISISRLESYLIWSETDVVSSIAITFIVCYIQSVMYSVSKYELQREREREKEREREREREREGGREREILDSSISTRCIYMYMYMYICTSSLTYCEYGLM